MWNEDAYLVVFTEFMLKYGDESSQAWAKDGQQKAQEC